MKRAPTGSITLDRPGTLFDPGNMFFDPEKRIYSILFVVDFQVFHLTHHSCYSILFIKDQKKRNDRGLFCVAS